MIPSSVRRVVAESPAVVSSLASSGSRATVSLGLQCKSTGLQQRRYSSSKPSSPDDGSRDFASRPAVPASRGSKTPGQKGKNQAKEAAPQPPSVPSTRHIGDEGLALSTFFALHRPISVTQLLPRTVSDDVFAKIFTPRSRANRVADVLSTLSQTVHDLEEPLSKLSIANGDKTAAHEAEDGSTKFSLRHADGSETSVYLQLNSMTGQYLPYAPPPAPEPVNEAAAEAAESATLSSNSSSDAMAAEELAEQQQEQQSQQTQTRVYKAMVTIEETVDAQGQYKVVAHSPELVEEGADGRPRSFLERMAERQLRYDEARHQQDRAMQAISVRRQRKLKMKKKKYKKLMRKTRNLRRKLDRL